MSNEAPFIRVICAVMVQNGKVFAARKGPGSSQPHKWEFPGGKVEANETDEQCLARELHEELRMEASVLKRLPSFYHQYPEFKIELVPFLCKPVVTEHQLLEHDRAGWFLPSQLKRLSWAEADAGLMDYVTVLLGTGESNL